MRRILVSTLLLSAAFLHAQKGTQGQSVTLEARNSTVTSLSDAAPATTDSGSAASRRISTGVTWPKLISEPNVSISSADFPTHDLTAQHLVVSFRVDEKGEPQNVHLLKSVNQAVDGRILAAVRQYRFIPGTLDDQNVPVDVNLIVNFEQK
jgi:TonB family protein